MPTFSPSMLHKRIYKIRQVFSFKEHFMIFEIFWVMCEFLYHSVLDAWFCINNALLFSHLRAVQLPTMLYCGPVNRFLALNSFQPRYLSLLPSVERNTACLMYVERWLRFIKTYLKVRNLWHCWIDKCQFLFHQKCHTTSTVMAVPTIL